MSCHNSALFNTSAGNSTFDLAFLVLQLAGVIFWILVIAKPKRFSTSTVRWVSVVVIVAFPLLWAGLFPEKSGIEGATRLIVAVPLVAMNILLAFAAYLRTKKP